MLPLTRLRTLQTVTPREWFAVETESTSRVTHTLNQRQLVWIHPSRVTPAFLGRARLQVGMALWSHVHVVVIVPDPSPPGGPLASPRGVPEGGKVSPEGGVDPYNSTVLRDHVTGSALGLYADEAYLYPGKARQGFSVCGSSVQKAFLF